MRRTRLAVTMTLLVGAAAPLIGGSATPAMADPQSDVRDAQAKLAALQQQSEVATERWLAARLNLGKAQQAQRTAEQTLARARSDVSSRRSLVGAAAAAEYKAGALGQVAVFFGSADPQSFLNRAADLGQISHVRGEQLAQLAAVVKRQTDAQTLVDQTTREARTAASSADTQKAAVDQSVAAQRSLLADALAQQAAVLAAARAAADRAAEQRALELQRQLQAEQLAAQASVAVSDDSASPARSGSGVAAVLAEAERQLGKPYVWGAAGPGSFDCSGLTMWAYRAAGVSLPHYTGAQFQMGRHVSRSELQPGDLVFFYSGLSHVGIYLGGGRMIHAPHSGTVVQISDMYEGAFSGAVRIFG